MEPMGIVHDPLRLQQLFMAQPEDAQRSRRMTRRQSGCSFRFSLGKVKISSLVQLKKALCLYKTLRFTVQCPCALPACRKCSCKCPDAICTSSTISRMPPDSLISHVQTVMHASEPTNLWTHRISYRIRKLHQGFVVLRGTRRVLTTNYLDTLTLFPLTNPYTNRGHPSRHYSCQGLGPLQPVLASASKLYLVAVSGRRFYNSIALGSGLTALCGVCTVVDKGLLGWRIQYP